MPFSTELMVCVLLIKQLFNLSDEQMEFQLLDRLSFQRFVGLRTSSQIPDRTTIWTFKECLIKSAASESIFDAINQQPSKHGYVARGGQMIDASLVQVPKQSLNKSYVDSAREERLTAQGLNVQIQRKGAKSKPISEAQQGRKHRIAKTRARIEHVFPGLAQMGGKALCLIGLARATLHLNWKVAAYNLQRLVYMKEAKITAF